MIFEPSIIAHCYQDVSRYLTVPTRNFLETNKLSNHPNRNATWAPLGAQVGCQVGPNWAAQVGPTKFCPGGPHGAQVGLPMCETSGSQLGPTYYFQTRTHFTPKWVPCLNLKVGLPTLVPCGEPKWDPLHFV